jgi:excisionase family DNA binding protein
MGRNPSYRRAVDPLDGAAGTRPLTAAGPFDLFIDAVGHAVAAKVLARLEPVLEGKMTTRMPAALRVQDAAGALSLSPSEVRRRIQRGELESVRVGRAVLVPHSAIDHFLATTSNGASQARSTD